MAKKKKTKNRGFISAISALLGIVAIIMIIARTIMLTYKYRKSELYIPLMILSTFFVVFGMVSSLFHYYNFSLPVFVLLAYIDYAMTTNKISRHETNMG